MPLIADLDEFPEHSLHQELARRAKMKELGKCDYCGRSPSEPTCRFPERHRASLSGWKPDIDDILPNFSRMVTEIRELKGIAPNVESEIFVSEGYWELFTSSGFISEDGYLTDKGQGEIGLFTFPVRIKKMRPSHSTPSLMYSDD